MMTSNSPKLTPGSFFYRCCAPLLTVMRDAFFPNVSIVCALLFSSNSYSAPQLIQENNHLGHNYTIKLISQGLGIPWGIAELNDTHLIITDRAGKLNKVNRNTGRAKQITGMPDVAASGQGGLLDVAIAPTTSDQDKQWIYFTYSKPKKSGAVTTLARAKLKPTSSTLSDWEDLLITKSNSNTTRHFGSRITFDNEGHLFFTIGDRGVRDKAQELDNHAGTVLRLRLDGSVPKDNPFYHQSGSLPEIWSYGHRNAQGISYDRQNRNLWLIEHGPRGGDEINLVRKGLNYGWPVISYGKEYWAPIAVGESTHKEGMEQPVKYYVPSIAPSGLVFYSGTAFPNWQNSLFSGALRGTHINHVTLSADNKERAEYRLIEDMNERIRNIIQSSEGWLYFTTDSGKLFLISPAS